MAALLEREKPGMPTCQVCGRRPGIGVASSSLGAFSLCYCAECADNNAEQLAMVHATLDLCGGPDHVAPWVKTVTAWNGERYIGWDEIVACYVPRAIPDEESPPTSVLEEYLREENR